MNPLLAEGEISPQVVLAIIFVIFSGLKWIYDNILTKNKSDSSDQYLHQDTNHPPNSGLADLYEQYREKIQAAQATHSPTQNVIQVHHTPPAPVTAPTPPPALPKPPTPVAPRLTPAEKAALAHIKANENAFNKKPKRRGTGAHASLRRMLDSPAHARQAIIVQEVLGQPKALANQPQTGPHTW